MNTIIFYRSSSISIFQLWDKITEENVTFKIYFTIEQLTSDVNQNLFKWIVAK